jgi:hypothetical protein
MKKLVITLMAILAATMFALGLAVDLGEVRQRVTGLEALIIFVVSLCAFPCSYIIGQLSLRMGRWFASAIGMPPYSVGQGSLVEQASCWKATALCFGAFGIGASMRAGIRGEPTVLIGLPFLGFAIGMNAGILFVEWLHRLRNRDR